MKCLCLAHLHKFCVLPLRTLLFAALTCLLLGSNPLAAIAAPTFDILSSDSETIGLGGKVLVRVNDLVVTDTKKVSIWLDDEPFDAVVEFGGDTGQLLIPLRLTDKNRAVWGKLLSHALENETASRRVKLQLAYGGTTVPAHGRSVVLIRTYDKPVMLFAFLLMAVAVALTIALCVTRSLLRDRALPQLKVSEQKFSLTRFQMTVWFCVVLAAFIYLGVLMSDLNTITEQTLILMGIAGATTVGSIYVDQNAPSTTYDAIKSQLATLQLTSLAEVEALKAAAKALPQGSYIGNPALQNIAVLQQYEKLVEPVRSEGFIKDMINDANGPSIHRWQMLAWTIVLAIIFIYTVYSELKMPEFGQNLLILMGISSAAFVAIKTTE